jgi:hypothetical protein
MVQLSTEELALVDDLLECIAEAMDRLENVDPEYASKTKLQKLLYLAIDEFNLPVTYSWYLAGAVVPDDAVTPSDLQSAFSDLPTPDEPTTPSPRAESTVSEAAEPVTEDTTEIADNIEIPEIEPDYVEEDPLDPVLFSGDSNRDTEPNGLPTELADRRVDVIDFYESKIPEVWSQNTMQFLQNFYLEHAPPAYRDLYVQSTHLRTRLREAEVTIESHLENEQPTRSIADIAEAASLDISDLHCTIRSSESLSATLDGFVSGTNLIEDGLMMLAKHEPESLTPAHQAAAKSMQEFYYYYVWRYPCLVISQETARGPSAESLRETHQVRLAGFEEELEREIDRFERELAKSGLKPDYTDYDMPDDELTETIVSLSDHYLE